MVNIEERLLAIQQRIERCASACQRDTADIRLLAVSKTRPVSEIKRALACGQRHFGENYLQEALEKIPLFGQEIEWHFIGRIQSNKTQAIAENFQWVQTIASTRVAERLSRQRPAGMEPLNACIQVDMDENGQHGGIPPEQVAALCELISGLPGLRLRGLMTIPLPTENEALQRLPFRRLRDLREQLVTRGFTMDTLSMGMTGDLEAAIKEGSTMVRIGTALFGPRPG